jgi:hypothetical protein
MITPTQAAAVERILREEDGAVEWAIMRRWVKILGVDEVVREVDFHIAMARIPVPQPRDKLSWWKGKLLHEREEG